VKKQRQKYACKANKQFLEVEKEKYGFWTKSSLFILRVLPNKFESASFNFIHRKKLPVSP
jgi:hypothetical protein